MKLRGRRCQCRTCGEYFNAASLFDQHRTGPYTLADGSCGRRCLTPDEMREKGMVQRADGFWGGEPMPEGVLNKVRSGQPAAIGAEPPLGTG